MKDIDGVVKFSSEQDDDILNILSIMGVLNKFEQINTEFTTSFGQYKSIYTYIYHLIQNDPDVEAQTKYWFQKAPDVNAATPGDPGAQFIRAVTEYGLKLDKKIDQYSQADIDVGMQKTSNFIGRLVVGEVLKDKGMPDFGTIISGDITAAIGNEGLSDFLQTLGGWGGSFYYWNAPLNHKNTLGLPELTVGEVIMNGGRVIINGQIKELAPSMLDFLYANSNALADALIVADNFAGSIPPTNLPYDGFDELILNSPIVASNSAHEAGIKKLGDDIHTMMSTAKDAQTPPAYLKILVTQALLAIVGRMMSGKVSALHDSDFTVETAADGTDVTTRYSPTESYTQDLNATDSSNSSINWMSSAGMFGTATIAANDALTIKSLNADKTIKDVAFIDADGRYNIVMGDGVQIAGGANDQDTLSGGVGDTSYELASFDTALKDVITDADGLGEIKIGDTVLTATNAKALGTANAWVDASGTQYRFTGNYSGSDIGKLLVSGGTVGAGQLEIDNFDLSQAQTDGYLGIHLAEQAAIEAGSAADPFLAGIYKPGNVTAASVGQTQGLTIYASAVSDTAQTVTLSLTGGTSNFKINTGANTLSFSGGKVTLTIPAGSNSVTVGLVYTGDPSLAATANLTATVQDTGAASASAVSNKLGVNFAAGAPATTGANIVGRAITVSSMGVSVPRTLFVTDSGNDQINAGSEDDLMGGSALYYRDAGENSVGSPAEVRPGTEGNSTLVGGGGRDIILGGNGNDQLYSGSVVTVSTALTSHQSADHSQGSFIGVGNGNNTLIGGVGDDAFEVGSGNNLIIEGAGNDTFIGGVKLSYVDVDWKFTLESGVLVADHLHYDSTPFTPPAGFEGTTDVDDGDPLGAGNDTIFGGAGNGIFLLANGNNYLDAGAGNDLVQAGFGKSTIYGGAGNDTILGGGGDNYIDGESGNDTIVGQGGHITVFGGSGNDVIYTGDSGAGFASSKAGTSDIEIGSGNTTVYGADGNDTIIGGIGRDVIYAGNGNEYVVAGAGNTSINGGAGHDTLIGGDGVDTIRGGSGITVIEAGDGGSDAAYTEVSAGSGATTIHGGAGVQHISGGSSDSVLYAGSGGDLGKATQVSAGTGNTTIYGGSGVDELFGGAGTNLIYVGDGGTAAKAVYAQAGAGNTTIYGGYGVDNIHGGAGSAVLYAGDGGTADAATSVVGGSGHDTLIAGAGNDQFFGGAGQATYLINPGSGSTVIEKSVSSDVLMMGVGITASNLLTTQTIYSNMTTTTLTLSQGGSVTVNSGGVNKVTFADGSTATFAQLLAPSYSKGTTEYSTVSATADAGTVKLLMTGSADVVATANSSNDLIQGNSGNDTLVAGTGKDTLVGGGDFDTYVIANGTQVTTIKQSGSGDVLTYGSGVTVANLSAKSALAVDGSSVITVKNSLGGSVVINTGSTNRMDQIAFADGSSVSLNTLLAQASSGSSAVTSAVSVTLAAGVQNMKLTGTANLTATGNALNDVITANTGNDTLIAGTGNTTLIGGGGIATYQVNATSGAVTINKSSASDTLVFGAGIDESQLTTTRTVVNGVNVTSISDGQGHSVTLQGGSLNKVQFANGDAPTLTQLRTSYTEGTTLYTNVNVIAASAITRIDLLAAGISGKGNKLNDVIVAGGGDDTLIAGTGNDTLIGGSYSEDYVIQAGKQITTIQNSGITDTLSFGTGVTLANLSATAALAADSTQTITVKNTLGGSVAIVASDYGPLQRVSFVDGSFTDLNALLAQATTGVTAATSAVDVTLGAGIQNMRLTGTANLTVTGNDLDDVITANSGNDTLIAGAGDSTLVGGSGLDTFQIPATSGSVTLVENSAQGANVSLGAGIQIADFTYSTTGSDLLLSDTVTGNQITLKNYTQQPTAWHLTDAQGTALPFVFAASMGQQILPNGASVVAITADITPTQLQTSRVQNDLLLTSGSDSLRIVNWYANPSNLPPLSIDFANGTVWTAKDLPSDQTYQFTTGGGHKTIQATYQHVVMSSDLQASSTKVARNGLDLLLAFGADSLTITGWYADPQNRPVTDIAFADGTLWSASTLTQDGLVQDGSAGNLTLTGLAGFNSTLIGGNNDTLVGSGNDVLVAPQGSGVITIANSSGGMGNTLELHGQNTNLAYADGVLSFYGSDNDRINVVGINPNDILGSSPIKTVSAGTSAYSLGYFANYYGSGIHELAGVGDVRVVGTNLRNYLSGGAGADTLVGAANDISDYFAAGSGLTTMVGGGGDEYFAINNPLDIIQAKASAKSNNLILLERFDYVIPDNVTTLSYGSQLTRQSSIITANSANDNINLYFTSTGVDARDTIYTGTGIDTVSYVMSGDSIFVNNSSDVINYTEAWVMSDYYGALPITLTSSVNFAVPTATADEFNIVLVGSGNANLTLSGSTVTGNSGNDRLTGSYLTSGSGVDTLIGGLSNNTFIVNNNNDVIVAQAFATSNKLILKVDNAVHRYVLNDYFNSATVQVAGVTLVGNSLSNTLSGGNDTLVAGSGVATLIGGSSTTFVVNNVADVVQTYGGFIQTSVDYSAGKAYHLTAIGSGNIKISAGLYGTELVAAGTGAVTLIGGDGVDSFVINSAADVIVEKSVHPDADKERTSVSTTMATHVNTISVSSTTGVTVSGNALDDLIIGGLGADKLIAGSGADTLNSGAGVDTLIAGTGIDVFMINNSDDVIVASNGNKDIVQAIVNYVLPANLTTLTGIDRDDNHGIYSSAITLTGNNLADVITANSYNDTLIAGTGLATLVGGGGSDTFVINNVNDVIIDTAAKVDVYDANSMPIPIFDTVQTSVNYTAASKITDVIGTGTANLTLTANTGNDLLIANSGADTLLGGTGTDVLQAGSGADTLKDVGGASALLAGAGNDALIAGSKATFIAGGTGSSAISLGAGNAVVAFNTGDGAATIAAGAGVSNVLSLGGSSGNGIAYSNLSFSKNGNNLVLNTGGANAITFTNWYAGAATQDFVTLQVLEQAASTYSATSTNTLYNQKVEEFDFKKLVTAFNQALAATPTLTNWSLMNGLLSAHLSGSDTAALGGDLAYYDGVNGKTSGLDLATAVSTLQNANFGKTAQTVDAWSGVSASHNKLH